MIVVGTLSARAGRKSRGLAMGLHKSERSNGQAGKALDGSDPMPAGLLAGSCEAEPPLEIESIPVASLRPYSGNARTHSKKQIRQIAESIKRFGFTNPVLISDEREIIAGHGRVEAAKLLGFESVPAVRLSHLTAAQRRAYVIADNQLALKAGWNQELLAIELQGLIDLEFDVELTGFSLAEVDIVLEEAREGSPHSPNEPEDQIPCPVDPQRPIVTQAGDIWCLGRHRLVCGDARGRAAFDLLMGNERADLIFTDPPYNVPIDGHVTGLGRIRHREFAMGEGEMSVEAFTSFLQQTLGHGAAAARDGAIAYVCMDWRHMGELLAPSVRPCFAPPPYAWRSCAPGLPTLRRLLAACKSRFVWCLTSFLRPHLIGGCSASAFCQA